MGNLPGIAVAASVGLLLDVNARCRPMKDRRLDEVRSFFAEKMVAASGSTDPRLERAFRAIPRELFFGVGPWKVMIGKRYIETPSEDPIHLYHNGLIALDETKLINNGEPFLHANWLGAVDIMAGDVVTHIGAGTGYYTAIMSMLVLPNGKVTAFEIDKKLAQKASDSLKAFQNVSVVNADATENNIPSSDVIYVNAGVVRPPLKWLEALKPNGRLIFPWAPASDVGIAVIVTKRSDALQMKPLMHSWFIPCTGASSLDISEFTPNPKSAWQVRSIHLKTLRKPDESAVAIYEDIWMSSKSPWD
jgi:protein-L-isoaspartate(D-aspartate) O-methyltransferase